MSSACFRSVRTYTGPRRRIVSGLGLASVILLWAVSASAQTAGTSTSQTCTQDPTYCSDIGGSTEHDYEWWNEQLDVERRFGWRQFEWRKFERGSRRGRADVNPQRSMRRRLPYGCLG